MDIPKKRFIQLLFLVGSVLIENSVITVTMLYKTQQESDSLHEIKTVNRHPGVVTK